jgi:hypothetical protein
MALEDVIIQEDFEYTYPRKTKLDKIRNYICKNRKLDKPIKVYENVLIDGYTRYLVAQEYEFEHIPCEIVNVFYVSGKLWNSNREYTWKVVDNSVIEVGDRVMVESDSYYDKKTKQRCVLTEIVTVTNVFTSDDMNMLRYKSIIKKVE